MPSGQEIVNALYGAWRFVLLDPRAMGYFEISPAGFWKSFFAAVIVAPAVALMVAFNFAGQAVPEGLLYLVLIQAVAYVINWTAYPLVCHWVCTVIDRERHFVPFIVAYNWTQVMQVAAYLPILVLELILPAQSAGLAFARALVVVWTLAYQWYVTRIALGVGMAAAAGMVGLDVLLKVLVQFIVLARLHQ